MLVVAELEVGAEEGAVVHEGAVVDQLQNPARMRMLSLRSA